MQGEYFIVFARSCRLGPIRERMASMRSFVNTVAVKSNAKPNGTVTPALKS
jgi:hypothetical protein